MEQRQFTVEGMSCSGCSSSVEKVVGALDGVEKAAVVLDSKQLTVTCDTAVTDEKIKSAVEEAGFEIG